MRPPHFLARARLQRPRSRSQEARVPEPDHPRANCGTLKLISKDAGRARDRGRNLDSPRRTLLRTGFGENRFWANTMGYQRRAFPSTRTRCAYSLFKDQTAPLSTPELAFSNSSRPAGQQKRPRIRVVSSPHHFGLGQAGRYYRQGCRRSDLPKSRTVTGAALFNAAGPGLSAAKRFGCLLTPVRTQDPT